MIKNKYEFRRRVTHGGDILAARLDNVAALKLLLIHDNVSVDAGHFVHREELVGLTTRVVTRWLPR